MGKRKKSTRKPQGPKKNDPLPTVFTCLFCNHEKSVAVKLDKKAGVGTLNCKVCGQKFQCGINYLSAAVDVYSEWVDAADAVAQSPEERRAAFAGSSQVPTGRRILASRQIDEEEDRRYGGEGIVADDEGYD
ncbi:transcription elongation factor Elf1 like-domain-containing protein [Phialemonium atrogriseum]|uniref:Transcription elongation factor 1 homolog n=1 Tax=Phialemonium atrogriseum TaxID=1093897 RepID=A0AAJ0FJF2_9PEZI|nr:transcription elongation factor Elf1 like-domain-containing protein [Phialemonium atrogriseum]KAK1770576.1 transcription elongation factor Elf1 like-domain-containing protein [Phialemonium atrogriseum]